MAYIVIKLHSDGRLERAERAASWRDREALIALAVFAQPALASLDVTAKLWRTLHHNQGGGNRRTPASA